MDEGQRERLLREMYSAFNARRVDEVLSALDPDVQWPNGWKGGWVLGREAVRRYWQQQWAEINPSVEPVAFSHEGPATLVTVHQLVRDLSGSVIFDGVVTHRYQFGDRLITRMDIEAAPEE